MQTQKDLVRKQILSAACTLFLKEGFSGVSMRDISRHSGVGLSNIYNYFKNKDDIFDAIVKPALDKLLGFGNKHHSEEIADVMMITNKEHSESIVQDFLAHISKFRTAYKLLFAHSHGSKYADFRQVYSDKMVIMSIEYFKQIKLKNPKVKSDFSETFLRITALTNLTMYELLATNVMTKDKIKLVIEEFVQFQIAGWRELMDI